MKKFITLVLISAGLFGFFNIANAQTKIGFISADEVIQLMPEAASRSNPARSIPAITV